MYVIYAVMGFDRFARTCSWNFYNPERIQRSQQVAGLSQVFSIFPDEHLLLTV